MREHLPFVVFTHVIVNNNGAKVALLLRNKSFHAYLNDGKLGASARASIFYCWIYQLFVGRPDLLSAKNSADSGRKSQNQAREKLPFPILWLGFESCSVAWTSGLGLLPRLNHSTFVCALNWVCRLEVENFCASECQWRLPLRVKSTSRGVVDKGGNKRKRNSPSPTRTALSHLHQALRLSLKPTAGRQSANHSSKMLNLISWREELGSSKFPLNYQQAAVKGG